VSPSATRRRGVVAFESLSYSHRKEYADWIVEAKREETRRRRAAETLERLRAPSD
jgi:uncharacterized protein YdeI (YjbR/CyaY-like superfamily)